MEEAAVRNTQDVDILLRRADLPAAVEAMTRAGFIHRHTANPDRFLDGPTARARDACKNMSSVEPKEKGIEAGIYPAGTI